MNWICYLCFLFTLYHSFIHSFIHSAVSGDYSVLKCSLLPIPILYSFQRSGQVPICMALRPPMIIGLFPLNPQGTCVGSPNLAPSEVCGIPWQCRMCYLSEFCESNLPFLSPDYTRPQAQAWASGANPLIIGNNPCISGVHYTMIQALSMPGTSYTLIPMRLIVLPLFYSQGNWGSQRLNDLVKFTYLLSS